MDFFSFEIIDLLLHALHDSNHADIVEDQEVGFVDELVDFGMEIS